MNQFAITFPNTIRPWMFLLAFLTACGPSKQEIEETSLVTCNLLRASPFRSPVETLRTVNEAREKLGKSLYTGSAREVSKSISLGLCEKLIADSPDYEELFEKLLAEDKVRAEKARKQYQKEKREKARAKAKAEAEAKEAARISRAEGERKYRKVVSDYVDTLGSKPKLVEIKFDAIGERVVIELECLPEHRGMYYTVRFKFYGNSLFKKNADISTLRDVNCVFYIETTHAFFRDTPDLMSKLKYAELEVTKIDTSYGNRRIDAPTKRRLDIENFDVNQYSGLEDGIKLVLFDKPNKT